MDEDEPIPILDIGDAVLLFFGQDPARWFVVESYYPGPNGHQWDSRYVLRERGKRLGEFLDLAVADVVFRTVKEELR